MNPCATSAIPLWGADRIGKTLTLEEALKQSPKKIDFDALDKLAENTRHLFTEHEEIKDAPAS